MIHIMVIGVGLLIMTTAITILLADLDLISSNHTVFVFFALEKLIHLNPIFISIAVFVIKPTWIRRLIRLIPIRWNYRTHAYVEKEKKRSSEADVHFQQLKNMW
uniref:Serpentine receptor class gamma n=1 Tax=Caenorhabditis tropicalis TaxID=1561998 RepID=A0A1I7UGR7_9PELO